MGVRVLWTEVMKVVEMYESVRRMLGQEIG